MEKKDTLFDRTIEYLKNRRFVVFLLLASAAIIAINENIDAIKNIVNSGKDLFSSNNDTSKTYLAVDSLIDTATVPLDTNSVVAVTDSIESQQEFIVSDTTTFPLTILTKKENWDIYIDNQFFGKSSRTVYLKRGNHNIKLVFDSIVYKDIVKIPDRKLLRVDQ